MARTVVQMVVGTVMAGTVMAARPTEYNMGIMGPLTGGGEFMQLMAAQVACDMINRHDPALNSTFNNGLGFPSLDLSCTFHDDEGGDGGTSLGGISSYLSFLGGGGTDGGRDGGTSLGGVSS